jgi:hypothetical protein
MYEHLEKSAYERLGNIYFPDQNSFIMKIDEEKLEAAIHELGGKGDTLILLDADNLLCSTSSTSDYNIIFDRIERYAKKLYSCSNVQKVACMNKKTSEQIELRRTFKESLEKYKYTSRLIFALFSLRLLN